MLTLLSKANVDILSADLHFYIHRWLGSLSPQLLKGAMHYLFIRHSDIRHSNSYKHSLLLGLHSCECVHLNAIWCSWQFLSIWHYPTLTQSYWGNEAIIKNIVQYGQLIVGLKDCISLRLWSFYDLPRQSVKQIFLLSILPSPLFFMQSEQGCNFPLCVLLALEKSQQSVVF